jgi:hypothetical protein
VAFAHVFELLLQTLEPGSQRGVAGAALGISGRQPPQQTTRECGQALSRAAGCPGAGGCSGSTGCSSAGGCSVAGGYPGAGLGSALIDGVHRCSSDYRPTPQAFLRLL